MLRLTSAGTDVGDVCAAPKHKPLRSEQPKRSYDSRKSKSSAVVGTVVVVVAPLLLLLLLLLEHKNLKQARRMLAR